jgi:hypothetical protein
MGGARDSKKKWSEGREGRAKVEAEALCAPSPPSSSLSFIDLSYLPTRVQDHAPDRRVGRGRAQAQAGEGQGPPHVGPVGGGDGGGGGWRGSSGGLGWAGVPLLWEGGAGGWAASQGADAWPAGGVGRAGGHLSVKWKKKLGVGTRPLARFLSRPREGPAVCASSPPCTPWQPHPAHRPHPLPTRHRPTRMPRPPRRLALRTTRPARPPMLPPRSQSPPCPRRRP